MSISSASFTVPGEIIGVAVGALRIEPRYQRPLDSRRVRHMAEHLDASQLGVIEVHRRPDSSLVVLDGQHRARAVLDSRGPEAVVMAHVVEGLTVAQEAERFLALNRERVASPATPCGERGSPPATLSWVRSRWWSRRRDFAPGRTNRTA